jgi:hypothetical protein
MKKLHAFLLFMFVGLSFQLSAQNQTNDMITRVVGKWKVVKYQSSKTGTYAKSDVLVFESDGTFRSDSIYFGSKKGLFRTDETRTVLIIDAGNKTTEWATTLKKGVLKMRSVPGDKQPKIYITLVRVKEEV